MADPAQEEPQFTSLSQRIAALKQNQAVDNASVSRGKRPPPPPPPSARPPLPLRTQTTNNPPLATYGSSVTTRSHNEPLATRETPSSQVELVDGNVRMGKGPPPLPIRKSTAPLLPPRSTEMVVRRDSSDSQTSVSTLSSLVLTKTSSVSSTASAGMRRMPPPLAQANLPPLPPTKRERLAAQQLAKTIKAPLMTTKSAPLLQSEFSRETHTIPGRPRLPPRTSRGDLRAAAAIAMDQPAMPAIPARPSRSNLVARAGPALPARNLPPSLPSRQQDKTRSVLTMGFNNSQVKTKEDSPPPPYSDSPVSLPLRKVSSVTNVIELDAQNFDQIVMRGRCFVDFYLPQCKACKDLEPSWTRLGEQFGSSTLTVAKMDVQTHRSFIDRFQLEMFPTLIYFDGDSAPENHPFTTDYDALADYLCSKQNELPRETSSPIPPPINLNSKPSLTSSRLVSQSSPKCLICRDYSAPDHVASQHPRSSLPSGSDMTGHLANVLCSSFPSHTDKARAIFTWLHHNIAYDTQAYFSKNVKRVAPQDTISTGLAVCGGYAGLFCAIALKAGLEAIMVSGHGKGYSFTAL